MSDTKQDMPDVIYAKAFYDNPKEGFFYINKPPVVPTTKYISERKHKAELDKAVNDVLDELRSKWEACDGTAISLSTLINSLKRIEGDV